MQQTSLGNIFIYDNRRSVISAFADMFDNRALKTYGSGNLYELLRYAHEIHPDALVFNLQNQAVPSATTLEYFTHKNIKDNFPIIVVKSQDEPFETHPRIAHYLHLPSDFNKLTDIVESYGHGRKNHRILLLDTYSPQPDALHNVLQHDRYSYFEVHNADAAVRYLRKNIPEVVLIEYVPDFIAARHTLQHPRVFYVDRHDTNAEIEKFLP